MSRVKVKDYKRRQHLVLNALRLVGLDLNYQTADLIYTTLEKVNELGDNFSVKDAVNIQVSHEKKWDEYFENKDKQKL